MAECPVCFSTDTRIGLAKENRGAAMDGRLRMHDVGIIGYLGCEECGETIRTFTQDEIEAMLND